MTLQYIDFHNYGELYVRTLVKIQRYKNGHHIYFETASSYPRERIRERSPALYRSAQRRDQNSTYEGNGGHKMVNESNFIQKIFFY